MSYFSVENLGLLDDQSIENRNDNDATEPKSSTQSIFWTAIKDRAAPDHHSSDGEIVISAVHKLSQAAERLRTDIKEKREGMGFITPTGSDAAAASRVSHMKEALDSAENFCDNLILSVCRLSSEYDLHAGKLDDVARVMKSLDIKTPVSKKTR